MSVKAVIVSKLVMDCCYLLHVTVQLIDSRS